ncbi:glycosyltransferase [Geobacter sp.]|uniref:glycosyltransferase n=1 Tax=Geobacter sp. TaxID=46610 RepID=UPI0027BA05A9|nr:glycosyltransferase [Geobacter sp.]
MKILVQPYTHTLSHISRPLAVARELRTRGHDVLFAGESSKKRFIEEEGFTVLPLFEPDPKELFGHIRSGKLQFISDESLIQMIEADVALYKEVRPDIVLSDGRFSAPLSTHLTGIKHAAIVNVSSTEYRALPYIPFFGWIPETLVSQDTGFRKFLDRFNLTLEMFVFDNAMGIFKKLSKQYGTKKPVTATNCLAGKDLTLLADIPEYFPTRNLPSDYIYIGPITWHQNGTLPPWWESAARQKPLIYFTMGSTGIEKMFNTVYQNLSDMPITAIVTTGGQKAGLRTLEGKIYVEEFLDGDKVMEICDLVVCHGGNGTIYQALQHGKPVLGIPTIPDQDFNMRRVEALGVGRMVDLAYFEKRPAILLQEITHMLANPDYTANAAKIQSILKNYNGPRAAADHIERLLNAPLFSVPA